MKRRGATTQRAVVKGDDEKSKGNDNAFCWHWTLLDGSRNRPWRGGLANEPSTAIELEAKIRHL